MRILKVALLLAVVNIVAPHIHAQSLWTSADFKYGLTKQWSIDAGAEYRTTDALKSSDRWSLGVGVGYKPMKFLKFDAGYKYIRQHSTLETTKKGNIIPAYWYDRHRIYVSATGKLRLGRFDLSLRERYQFTQRVGKWVPKFDSDGLTPKDDEWISNKSKHVLRSRLECEYDIKKSRFTPSVSVELYDNLSDKFNVERIRYTVGCAYKINKHNSVDLFYRYIQVPSTGNPEDRGHIIGIGYNFKL
ncbi:MAG: DUF2490 domain-containing protein [Muribaculaceae bacterium]|nr:DUF2490 domain-containing protein [Muribaculaceae bacterium]